MGKPLQVLLFRDSGADLRPIIDRLSPAFEPRWVCADSVGELGKLLARQEWDVVIADLADPERHTAAVAAAIRGGGVDLALIVVSEKPGEILAVSAMRAGARGYLLKADLTRLVVVVERELAEMAVRRELRRSESEARRTAERFARLVNSATDLFLLFDQELRLIEANSAAVETLKPVMELRPGVLLAELSKFARRKDLVDLYREVLRTGRPLAIEDIEAELGGRESHWMIRAFKVDGGLGIRATDITDQRHAEEALRRSDELLRTVVANAPLVLFATDNNGNFTLHTGSAVSRTGRLAGELVGRNYREFLADRPDAVVNIERALAGEDFVAEIAAPDTGEVFETRYSPIRDAAGQPAGMIGVALSITERRRAEEVLHDQSRMLDAFFEHSLTPIVFLDTKFNFIRVNEAYARACSRPAEDFIGRNHFDLYPDAENKAIFESVVAGRRPYRAFAKPFNFPDHPEWGVTYWDWSLIPMLGPAGEVEFLVFSLEDVTARVRAEEDLRRAEQDARFQSRLLDMAMDSIFVHDLEGRMIYVNQAAHERRGYTREELLAMTVPTLDTPAAAARFPMRSAELLRSGEAVFETEHRCKNGEVLPVEVHARLAEVDGKQLVISVVREITERRRAEAEKASLQAQLLQAQKMEAIGRLAGGVAHDFNNMMTAVTGHARRLLRRLGKDDPTRRSIEEILKGGERATSLTRQLLAFSRKQIFRMGALDLNVIAADMESMLRRLLGEDVALITRLEPGLWQVRADSAQIAQVIVNLAVNARDAMPEGGALTVRTANVTLSDHEELARLELPAGEYAMLSVEDTGHGMDPEAVAHAFEPFFTTKPPGEGTGLGLSTVYGIVKQSGGGISFESRPGKGTIFRIYLPRTTEAVRLPVPAEPAPAATPAPSAPAPREKQTILLVEDEAVVRKLISLELEDAGYQVLQAANPGEALSVSSEYRGPVELLLSDVILPGMSGPRLHDALAPLRPETRVLYISGHTEKYIVQHGVLNPGTAFLEKPFAPEALIEKVREVLSGKS